MRGNITSLFITSSKLYKSVSKSTVAKWIKSSLVSARIYVSSSAPHVTGSSLTNKARWHVPMDTVLNKGNGATCHFTYDN